MSGGSGGYGGVLFYIIGDSVIFGNICKSIRVYRAVRNTITLISTMMAGAVVSIKSSAYGHRRVKVV